VQWSFSAVRLNQNTIEFTAEAIMKDNWVIYSQDTEAGGPIPTVFTLNHSEIMLEEKSKHVSEFDEIFEVTVKKFKNKAVFHKKVTGDFQGGSVSGSVTFMTCDGQKCLPPATVEFNLVIN
jgi:thiol:disulfide interchange protein DsbD